MIKRILFLEYLYEKIVSDTESCLVENLACRFFVPKSVIRRAEAVSNPEMMPDSNNQFGLNFMQVVLCVMQNASFYPKM